MATINTISNSVFDSILPPIGKPAKRGPVWNEGQKMFIVDEYESAAGHRYYKGIRFCEQLAIVEIVGNYHTWTYIDGIEIYGFDGHERKLLSSMKFDKVFYDKEFIKNETKKMLKDIFEAQCKLTNQNVEIAKIEEHADLLIERSYTSLLNDDYSSLIREMLPVLVPQKLLQ